MPGSLADARRDARELRALIRRRMAAVAGTVVLGILSVAGIPIAKTVATEATSSALATALGIAAMLCLGAAVLLVHHVTRLRSILSDVEGAISGGHLE